MLGWLDPFALAAEAGADLNGAEDRVGAGFDLIGVLDQKLGGEAQIFAAPLVEAGGARVAIDGAVIPEIVIPLNQFDVVPGNEILFDIGAVGMIADDAFAGVMLEGGGIRNTVAVRGDGFGDVPVEYFGDVLRGITGWNDFGELDLFGVTLGFERRSAFGALHYCFAHRKDDLGGVGFRRLGLLIGGRSDRCEGGG